jgi:hypothetical protein
MIGLIQSLDAKSKEDLKIQYDKLLDLRNRSAPIEEYEKAYSEITNYLHKSWLKELRARPRMTGEAHLGSS